MERAQFIFVLVMAGLLAASCGGGGGGAEPAADEAPAPAADAKPAPDLSQAGSVSGMVSFGGDHAEKRPPSHGCRSGLRQGAFGHRPQSGCPDRRWRRLDQHLRLGQERTRAVRLRHPLRPGHAGPEGVYLHPPCPGNPDPAEAPRSQQRRDHPQRSSPSQEQPGVEPVAAGQGQAAGPVVSPSRGHDSGQVQRASLDEGLHRRRALIPTMPSPEPTEPSRSRTFRPATTSSRPGTRSSGSRSSR